MADINKKEMVAQATGLPTKEQLMTSDTNRDTLSAKILNQDGTETPAALTEGEFVFSLPAIIALGDGNYDAGIELLNQIHEELKNTGKAFLQEQEQQGGLAGVPLA